MKHQKSIDFIRAVAVFIVLARHFLPEYPLNHPLGVIQHLFQPTGAFAVILFFVLSGFLITSILLHDKAKTDNRLLLVGNFLARRVLRIFPAYFLLLFILMIIGFPFLPGELPYQLTFTSNYFFYNTSVPTHTAHTWSLAVEEQFYLLWPFLIIYISSWYHPMIFFICSIISLFSAWYFGCPEDYSCGLFRNILTSSNLVAFAIGGMYANLVARESGKRKLGMIIRYSLIAVMPFFLFWALAPLMQFESRFEFLRIAAYAILSICIIHYLLGLERGAIKTKLVDNKWIGLTGMISYGIYLYHLPIQYYFAKHLIPLASGYGLPQSLYFWFIPFYATVFVSAYLSFTLIESGFLKLKRHFSFTKS